MMYIEYFVLLAGAYNLGFFIFLFARDSNKEGAGSPAEENSPVDCF